MSLYHKLSYRRGTARCSKSVEILSTATQYYEKSQQKNLQYMQMTLNVTQDSLKWRYWIGNTHYVPLVVCIVTTSHRFRDITRFDPFEFFQDFLYQKTSHWAIVWRCFCDNMFSRFDRTPTCDGRTDGRTDTRAIAYTLPY